MFLHIVSPRNIFAPRAPLQSEYSVMLRFRCINSLKSQVAKVDGAFDKCSNVWCAGEAEGFFTDKLLILISIVMDIQRKTKTDHCFDFVDHAHVTCAYY